MVLQPWDAGLPGIPGLPLSSLGWPTNPEKRRKALQSVPYTPRQVDLCLSEGEGTLHCPPLQLGDCLVWGRKAFLCLSGGERHSLSPLLDLQTLQLTNEDLEHNPLSWGLTVLSQRHFPLLLLWQISFKVCQKKCCTLHYNFIIIMYLASSWYTKTLATTHIAHTVYYLSTTLVKTI